ncbi:hypothetical protein KIPB_010974, partial [Kipferlia bialata]
TLTNNGYPVDPDHLLFVDNDLYKYEGYLAKPTAGVVSVLGIEHYKWEARLKDDAEMLKLSSWMVLWADGQAEAGDQRRYSAMATPTPPPVPETVSKAEGEEGEGETDPNGDDQAPLAVSATEAPPVVSPDPDSPPTPPPLPSLPNPGLDPAFPLSLCPTLDLVLGRTAPRQKHLAKRPVSIHVWDREEERQLERERLERMEAMAKDREERGVPGKGRDLKRQREGDRHDAAVAGVGMEEVEAGMEVAGVDSLEVDSAVGAGVVAGPTPVGAGTIPIPSPIPSRIPIRHLGGRDRGSRQ